MAYNLKDKLVVAVSSRALFDLESENKIFEEKGLDEDVVADHLEDIFGKELTFNQENDILESGMEEFYGRR